MSGMRRLHVGGALLSLALSATEAGAQMSVGANLQIASRYQWRGITRAQAWVLQPALSAATGELCPGSQTLCLSVAAGVWANYQLSLAGANELSDLPPGTRGFSEWNPWLEGTVRHELFEGSVGVVRYVYTAADSGGLRTSADNTTEVYLRARLPRVPWAKPTLVAWWDVDRVKGWFIEGSADAGLGLVPMVMNLDLGLAGGVSLGQERSLSMPTEPFNSTRRGLTYVELKAGPSFNGGAIPRLEPLRVAFIFHLQVSSDDLTKRASRASGATRTVFTWLTLSGSWTWPTRR